MQAKVLQADRSFLGKLRKVGDVLTDEEMAMMTQTTITALVNNGVIEVEGMHGPGAGLSANDSERLDRLQASADRTNELLGQVIALLGDKKLAKALKAKA